MKNKNEKNKRHHYDPNHIFLTGGEIGGLIIGGVGNALLSGILASQINDMSHIEDQIEQIRNTDFNAGDNNSLMQLWTNAQNLNVDLVTFEDVYGSSQDRTIQGIAGVASGLATAMTGNWIGGLVLAGASAIGTGIGSLIAKRKAEEKVVELNRANLNAREQRALNFDYAVDTVEDLNTFNFLSNYAADGGPLFTNGGIWSNGLTFIGNGGTHEENPFEGVPMGIAPDGIPNLVEEGEVIYNDYVFSNRLKANKTLLDKYNLPTKYEGKSFAEITKAISKESEERPNDPISKKGLEDSMAKLQTAQEEVREMKLNKKQNIEIPLDTMFDKGGVLVRKWADVPTLGISEGLYPGLRANRAMLIGLGITPKPLSLGVQSNTILPLNSNINSTNNGTNNFNWTSLLRYAPVAVQGITALTDALGKTNKPDYSNPNLIAANTLKIAYKPVGNYLTYKPFDINYAANKLANQAAATRRAALDLSGGNRGTAMANLLAADLNAQTALGDAYVESWLANREQELKVEDFNRGTNMANSQMGLTADLANLRIALESAVQQAAMREAIDRYISEAKSTNLNTFLDNIQGIGREMDAIREAKKTMEALKAHGGKLNKRKKKGLTC